MNLLQDFMAECNRQTRIGSGTEEKPQPINQEAFIINGAVHYGTLSDPQMLPEMVRHGHQDEVAYVLKTEACKFASRPSQRQEVTRCVNNEVFYGRMVETKDPVVYTFLLVDREL